MLINTELLREYHAGQEGLAFIEKLFPNGFTTEDLCQDKLGWRGRKVPVEFIHWGYQNLPLSEEDKRLYWDYFRVSESSGVYKSTDTARSITVSDSSFVKDSKRVLSSSEIENSQEILLSEKVKDSKFIYNSKNILRSDLVINSNNIIESQHVYESDTIESSEGIFKSSNVRMSIGAVDCSNIYSSYLLRECINLENAILCEGIGDGRNLIFNKQVNEDVFNRAEIFIIGLLAGKTFPVANSIDSRSILPVRPAPIEVLYTPFSGLDVDTWKQISNYFGSLWDPQIAYDLSFNSRILTLG